jgi:type II secretory ATPase GspE/PulE/Tfp pilus assembly ATPase PilB-like protein
MMESSVSPSRSAGPSDAAETVAVANGAEADPSLPLNPALTSFDDALAKVLVKYGLLSDAQVREAILYSREHRRDLKQAVMELNLISAERLNTVAFEHLTTVALQANGSAAIPEAVPGLAIRPSSPDRAKLQHDLHNELMEVARTNPLPVLVAQILERGCESRATDIHFDPHEKGIRVRYRIDGQLQEVLNLDPAIAAPVLSRLKVMSELNIVDRKHSQDGRITIQHSNRPRDLRVATFPTILGEKIVIRIHDVLIETHSFAQLGMAPRQVEQLDKLVAKPYGAILVAGPVGSGKTTTLYSSLAKVNEPTRNVMTIEDPIENRIAGVNQTQISSDLGFSDSLRAMLRQDPDVIMIGEIRDDETARIGIRAAATGVLVFSSVHGSDSPSTIGNLYNFGIPGYLLSNSLIAIVSQRLVRRICPYCRVSYQADPMVLEGLGLQTHEQGDLVLHRGAGCPACFQTGYLGRTGIFEIMELSDELRDLVFQQIPKDVLHRVAVDLGMQTLRQSAVDKILDGTTTVEEAYRVVSM